MIFNSSRCGYHSSDDDDNDVRPCATRVRNCGAKPTVVRHQSLQENNHHCCHSLPCVCHYYNHHCQHQATALCSFKITLTAMTTVITTTTNRHRRKRLGGNCLNSSVATTTLPAQSFLDENLFVTTRDKTTNSGPA